MPNDLQFIKDSLKRDIMKAAWWDYVRNEVRAKLDWLVDHIEDVGLLYRECFDFLFRYEHAARQIEGVSSPENMLLPLNMSGYAINEESYQCGKLPVRVLLHLEDYFEPNDAEVQACLYICHQIDILKQGNYIKPSKYQMKSPAELKLQQIIATAVNMAQKATRKKQKELPQEGKTLNWKFEDEDAGGSSTDIDGLI